MTKPIPQELREKVICEFLKRGSGNEVARYLDLGQGTVSGIIREWYSKLEDYEPKSIRELACEMRRAEITPREVRRACKINQQNEGAQN